MSADLPGAAPVSAPCSGLCFRTKVGLQIYTLPILKIIPATRDDQMSALDQLHAYRQRRSMSFTDCASFIVMRRLGLRKVFTEDADFTEAGFESWPA